MISIAVVDGQHNKSNFWEAEELSKKPTTSTSKSTAKAICRKELSKKPTSSTSKSTAKSIHNGMLAVIWDCTRPPNEWKLGIVEKIVPCRETLTRIADVRTSHVLIRSPVSELLIVFFDKDHSHYIYLTLNSKIFFTIRCLIER